MHACKYINVCLYLLIDLAIKQTQTSRMTSINKIPARPRAAMKYSCL